MLSLKISIVRFVSNDQANWVEGKFHDAWNYEFTVHEKVPIITTEDLDAISIYPRPGYIACTLIKQSTDQEGRIIMTINTEKPYGVETIDGISQFDVLPEQLIDK
jgi:hypothetical protein